MIVREGPGQWVMSAINLQSRASKNKVFQHLHKLPGGSLNLWQEACALAGLIALKQLMLPDWQGCCKRSKGALA